MPSEIIKFRVAAGEKLMFVNAAGMTPHWARIEHDTCASEFKVAAQLPGKPQ
jgi:hypothetical protein